MAAPVIYLDHQATTPCDPEVVHAMAPWWSEQFGNPASRGHRPGLLREYNPGDAIHRLRGQSPESVLEEIKKSGLRGMGGAFFPIGIKWESCRKDPESPKYIFCNADEGEPGTFKDRVLLNSMPGLVLEGMVTAGFAVGSEEGVIYLRAEYKWMQEKIQHVIERFRKMNLLGRNIAGIEGFNFNIRIQLGAGAYVCGEETAMLNSIEGKRGEPRNKRFFPTERGYMQKPTVINNVETYALVSWIVRNGAEAFAAYGTEKSKGTKGFALAGQIQNTGLIEVPMGVTLREMNTSQLEQLTEELRAYLLYSVGQSGGHFRGDQILARTGRSVTGPLGDQQGGDDAERDEGQGSGSESDGHGGSSKVRFRARKNGSVTH